MSRNGSGTMTASLTFSPSTPALSADVNSVLADIAAEITNSLAKDGQTVMTGQIKAADGSASAPGVAFGSDLNTGAYRISADTVGFAAGGAEIFRFNSSGIALASGKTLTGSNAFATGTKMLFIQTAAPTGWTKDTTHDNKALRIVSGTAGTGGSVAFTTAFASQAVTGTTNGTALTTAQIPAHTHTTAISYTTTGGGGSSRRWYGQTGTLDIVGSDDKVSSSVGSGDAHTHAFTGTAINLAVSYVDTIIATKD